MGLSLGKCGIVHHIDNLLGDLFLKFQLVGPVADGLDKFELLFFELDELLGPLGLELVVLIDDVLPHLVDVVELDVDGVGVEIDDVPFDVPVDGLGDFDEDLLAG